MEKFDACAGGQCIHCTVETCAYNKTDDCRCSLAEITVAPNEHAHSGKPCDECNCSNYAPR